MVEEKPGSKGDGLFLSVDDSKLPPPPEIAEILGRNIYAQGVYRSAAQSFDCVDKSLQKYTSAMLGFEQRLLGISGSVLWSKNNVLVRLHFFLHSLQLLYI